MGTGGVVLVIFCSCFVKVFLSPVNVQKGGNCVGLSDLHLVDQLCVYMNGGRKSLVAMETSSGVSQLVMVSIPLLINVLR